MSTSLPVIFSVAGRFIHLPMNTISNKIVNFVSDIEILIIYLRAMIDIVNKKFHEDRYANIKHMLTSAKNARENFKPLNQ